jgi:hypothetical protein
MSITWYAMPLSTITAFSILLYIPQNHVHQQKLCQAAACMYLLHHVEDMHNIKAIFSFPSTKGNTVSNFLVFVFFASKQTFTRILHQILHRFSLGRGR